MALEVIDLIKQFDHQIAVDGISFTIDKPQVMGFLGPNGAGKTTTMKMIAGCMQPSSGKVRVYNMDVVTHSLEAKRMMGYLPEHNPLYIDMYVRESLQFTAAMYKLDKPLTRINRVIEEVGLGDEQYKKIAYLSKGYRQRLGIAQAILHDPKLLILDEPTSGLDPNQLTEVRHLIRTLAQDKIVVLSTHIMQEVEAICDEVMVVNKGKLVRRFELKQLPKLFDNRSLEQVFSMLTMG